MDILRELIDVLRQEDGAKGGLYCAWLWDDNLDGTKADDARDDDVKNVDEAAAAVGNDEVATVERRITEVQWRRIVFMICV